MTHNPESVKILTIFLVLVSPIYLLSQSFEVTGTVKDSEGRVLPYANVLLSHARDSSLFKGVSANENGFFRIGEIPPQLYLLKASYFGDESDWRPLDINGDISMGAIIIDKQGQTLDEVVVTAIQPSLERRADRVVFHVENSVVTQGNSWDIIRNTPGVINIQGNLEIRGQKATIYMNDRKVHLSQVEVQELLEGLSGTTISSIELIHNPPARYDAEGGPILNIVTSRNISPGYKGSVQGNYTQATFPKYSTGTSHYWKSEKLNVFANYTINPRKEWKEVDSDINFINPQGNIFARWTSALDKTTRSQSQQASFVLDYDLDKRNRFNITSNLAFSPNKTIRNIVEVEMRNGQGDLDSLLNTVSDLDDDHSNIAIDLNYEHRMKKEGALVKVNVHHTRFDQDQVQSGSSDYFNPAGDFIRNYSFLADAGQEVDISTAQVDFLTPLGKTSFESGVKVSAINSDSKQDLSDGSGGIISLNPALSDDFRYEEKVYAGYLSILNNWDKWSLKLGLRGEQTNVEGISGSLSVLNSQNYFELFPSFYLMHSWKEDHSMSFDYSRKLRRPNYRDLNPFRYFLNENDFNEGNPGLQPNFSHNFNLNYTFKNTWFFDIYYRDNGNYISNLSFQDNQAQTLRQVRQNVLESISYGLDFTVGKSLMKKWYLYSYTSLFSESETLLAEESNNVPYKNKVEGFYAFLGNYITLSGDGSLTGELSLTYISGFLDGSYKLSETTNLNLGIRKSFWNDRAVVSLAAEDILGKANATYVSRYLNQDNSFSPLPETRFVRLGFTYKFGNAGLSDNERDLKKEERDRLLTQ